MDVKPAELYEIFRSNMREMREEANLSQAELARITGIKQPQISDLERGSTNPNLASIARIAEALEVPPWIMLRPAKTRSEQKILATA
jgi:transcriptional regulator with XRE-family HTH domain